MVARLVKMVGSYSITRDERDRYFLLDGYAREVATSPCLKSLEAAVILCIQGGYSLRVCAWCKKLTGTAHGKYESMTTHGICLDCISKLEKSK